jgi:hypothetical protein
MAPFVEIAQIERTVNTNIVYAKIISNKVVNTPEFPTMKPIVDKTVLNARFNLKKLNINKLITDRFVRII